MTQLKVYIVSTSGKNDAEPFNDILGVFADLSDAKAAMAQDIEQIKKDWDHIDFNNSEEWESSESELCYEGFTLSDDYQYSIVIKEMPVRQKAKNEIEAKISEL